MAKVFFSYSHKDEALRDQLETHLALLKNQGLIESGMTAESSLGLRSISPFPRLWSLVTSSCCSSALTSLRPPTATEGK